jgi:hypothetical protein
LAGTKYFALIALRVLVRYCLYSPVLAGIRRFSLLLGLAITYARYCFCPLWLAPASQHPVVSGSVEQRAGDSIRNLPATASRRRY